MRSGNRQFISTIFAVRLLLCMRHTNRFVSKLSPNPHCTPCSNGAYVLHWHRWRQMEVGAGSSKCDSPCLRCRFIFIPFAGTDFNVVGGQRHLTAHNDQSLWESAMFNTRPSWFHLFCTCTHRNIHVTMCQDRGDIKANAHTLICAHNYQIPLSHSVTILVIKQFNRLKFNAAMEERKNTSFVFVCRSHCHN